MAKAFREFNDVEEKSRVNLNRLNPRYFITQSNGTIISHSNDDTGNEFTYALGKDGTVRYRKNEGVWKVLSIIDAGSIRYFVGKFLYKKDIPHYHTNHIVV